MNTQNFETSKNKLESLIKTRPIAFKSFGYYSALRITCLVIGFLLFALSLAWTYESFKAYYLLEQLLKNIEENPLGQFVGDTVRNSVQDLFQFNYSGIVLFFLSITFFLMARLCKNIKKRNDYIKEIETAWNDMKLNSVNKGE